MTSEAPEARWRKPVQRSSSLDIYRLQSKYGHAYEFINKLGTGAFCTVYKAMDRQTGEVIAVKVIIILH